LRFFYLWHMRKLNLLPCIVLLALCLNCAPDLRAQHEGVYIHAGISMSDIRNDANSINFSKLNLSGGIGVISREDEHFFLGAELNLAQKGARNFGISGNQFELNRVDMYYLQLAGFGGYQFDEHWGLFLGPVIGAVLFQNDVNVLGPGGSDADFRGWELSGLAGLRYDFSEHVGVMLRLEHSVLRVLNVEEGLAAVQGGRTYHATAGLSLYYSFN